MSAPDECPTCGMPRTRPAYVRLVKRIGALEEKIDKIVLRASADVANAAVAENRSEAALGHLRAVVIAHHGGMDSIHASIDHAREFLRRVTGRDPISPPASFDGDD